MALLAEDAADRAAQLLLLTERLGVLVVAETQTLAAGQPLAGDGGDGAELRRLANAYRLEMARIRADANLIAPAPRPLRERLQAATEQLQGQLETFNNALSAAREITEGLVRAVAEEVQRARKGPAGYDAQGGYADASTLPVALDQRA